MEALAVALGGALGSLGRWGIGGALRTALPDLPAGTFVANVLAGLIIGEQRTSARRWMSTRTSRRS